MLFVFVVVFALCCFVVILCVCVLIRVGLCRVGLFILFCTVCFCCVLFVFAVVEPDLFHTCVLFIPTPQSLCVCDV